MWGGHCVSIKLRDRTRGRDKYHPGVFINVLYYVRYNHDISINVHSIIPPHLDVGVVVDILSVCYNIYIFLV